MRHTHTITRTLDRRIARIGSSHRLNVLAQDVSSAPDAAAVKGALCIPVNYALPGVFPARKQSSDSSAWATQVTVLLSWRDDKPYTEEQALALVAPAWVERLAQRQALTADETAMLIGSLGLCTPPPQLLSSEAWAALLRIYGPIAIIEGDAEGARLPARGRIVYGIGGDGAPSATQLEILDTSTGEPAKLSLQQLGGPYRLLHWHADAGLAAGARPTAPAPAAIAPREAGGGETTNVAEAKSWSRARSTRAGFSYARDVPSWDVPSAFPPEIRAFWADRNSRLHHYTWHFARSNWTVLTDEQKKQVRALGFSDPPRLAASRSRSVADPGAGVDFLNMHRQMFAATRAIALQLGGAYRPQGWNPIPWSHTDPVWPMPVWPGSPPPAFKERTQTAYWQNAVDALLQPKRLAATSLDVLGTTIEEGIHNWLHMHWANPTPADQFDTAPSADYLGSTFSSQVNPVFWKLHGWIDECIERWENAPVTAGTGSKRSAGAELAKFGWLGPMPKPPTSGSKSLSVAGHEHGMELTESEVHDVLGVLAMPEPWEFPFADLPVRDLVARFGDAGEITVAQLDAIAPNEGGMPMMASLRWPRTTSTRRHVPVGPEKHAVRSMDVIGDAIDFGRSLFKKITKRAEEGRFAVKSDVAEIMNADTPAIAPWTRTTAILKLKATAPSLGAKDLARGDISNDTKTFRLKLSFEHNGYDIREGQVLREIQGSSEMTSGKFEIAFTAKNATNKRSEIGRVDFLITGKWDPGVGDKFFDFSGKLFIESDGDFGFDLDKVDRVQVDFVAGTAFSEVNHTALIPPTIIKKWHTVFFSPPNSDKITNDEMERLKTWLTELRAEDVRYRRLREGAITVFVDGYASPTGTGQLNQDLSARRALKVANFLKQELGTAAKIEQSSHGEQHPGDKKEDELETERRVDVWFEIPL